MFIAIRVGVTMATSGFGPAAADRCGGFTAIDFADWGLGAAGWASKDLAGVSEVIVMLLPACAAACAMAGAGEGTATAILGRAAFGTTASGSGAATGGAATAGATFSRGGEGEIVSDGSGAALAAATRTEGTVISAAEWDDTG